MEAVTWSASDEPSDATPADAVPVDAVPTNTGPAIQPTPEAPASPYSYWAQPAYDQPPTFGSPYSGADRRHRRRRVMTVFGAVAVVAVATGSAFAVAGSASSPVPSGSPPPGSQPLSALPPVTGAFESNDGTPIQDGKSLTDVLDQDIGCVSGADVVYATNGDFSVFTALLGLDDHSLYPGDTPEVRIYGDGRLLGSYRAAPARTTPVKVHVRIAGVNLLKFTWSYPATAAHAGSACRPVSTLLIGDPLLE
jgi:hypothetical protein